MATAWLQSAGEPIVVMSERRAPLLESLGEEEGCKRLARDFYARVATCKELKPLFPGKSIRCATEEFAAFLIQFLGGDENQTQYRWWLSLRESHARFKISESQREAWLRLMSQTIDSLICDATTRASLVRFFQATSAYLMGSDDVQVDESELDRRWSQQRALDQTIEHISQGRDDEAITLASQFACRPSVFVGILARMMDSERQPLISFVLEALEDRKNLSASRFNGRTLLHFAAGSGCLPVVEKLLRFGVNPNLADDGGHSPLYRAASSHNDVMGAAVAVALVKAGAAIDQSGGVNRSTPLHQAARFGKIRIAEVLLAHGASPNVKDKKGLTPLDRAVNCRKQDVVSLLSRRQ